MPVRSLLVAALLLLVTGCGAAVRSAAAEAPRTAVPVIVDETLKAGEDQKTRDRVAAVLATPEMQRSIREIARAAVKAALDEAASDENEERVAKLTDTVARTIAEDLRAYLREAVTPESTKGVEDIVTRATTTAMTTAMRALAREIPSTLGPAVRESLTRELQSPDLRASITGLVDQAARQVIASSHEELTATRTKMEEQGEVRPMDLLQRMTTMARVVAIATAVIGVILGAWMIQVRRQARRFRRLLLELASAPDDEDEEHRGERRQRVLALLQ